MTTNIVMLVKDRDKLTTQSLDSLYAHTPSDQFNLTIIDDCSKSPVYRPLTGNMAVLRLETSKGITGQARNLGVYWAEKYWGRGEYLYLSDNDVYFTEGWMEKLIRALQIGGELDYRLVGGSTHPFHGYNTAHQFLINGEPHSLRSHDAVSGYSQLMRWEVWDKYGPLDAHAPGIRQSEDWAMCQKIIKDGGRVGSLWPEVVYCTGLTDTYGEPAIGQEHLKRYEGIIQE